MACAPEELKHVPLFALLDDDETAILAAQVEVREFAARQRIYKLGDPSGPAYVVMSGSVREKTVDFLEIATRLGASAVLAKPFSTDALMRAIDALLLPGKTSPGQAA